MMVIERGQTAVWLEDSMKWAASGRIRLVHVKAGLEDSSGSLGVGMMVPPFPPGFRMVPDVVADLVPDLVTRVNPSAFRIYRYGIGQSIPIGAISMKLLMGAFVNHS